MNLLKKAWHKLTGKNPKIKTGVVHQKHIDCSAEYEKEVLLGSGNKFGYKKRGAVKNNRKRTRGRVVQVVGNKQIVHA